MPLAESTSWLTVPLGFTVVMATDWLMPSFDAQALLVSMALAFMALSHVLASSPVLDSTG